MNSSMPLACLGLSASCLAWGQTPTPVPNATILNTIVRENLSGHYRLTEDLNLNETDYIPWVPIGSPQQPFKGTLDGNNRLICGLTVDTADDDYPTGLFSVLQDAYIHHLALVQPLITSDGMNCPSGALAGKAQGNTTIHHTMVINGQVVTLGEHSVAGTQLGEASGNTTIHHTMVINGQVVTWDDHSVAGTQLGEASGNTWIQQTLVTGDVKTNGTAATAGGQLGKLTDRASIKGTLASTTVTTDGLYTPVGNLLGSASDNTSVQQTLSSGNVTANKRFAHAGSHLGTARNNTWIKQALAVGNVVTHNEGSRYVHTLNKGSITGGFMGSTDGTPRIEQTLTTSTVTTYGPSRIGSQLGELSPYSQWDQNLSTGNVIVNNSMDASVGTIVGLDKAKQTFNNMHVIGHVQSRNGSENTHQLITVNKTHLPSGLDPSLWTLGNDNQYPILTGINPAWQDLRRIHGTQDGRNVFPAALLQLAVPGPASESLFDRAHWNLQDGYLPFLKGVGQERAEQAGLDCEPGGFACTEASCEAPLGIPGFQTFDPDTGHLYAVAHQPETHRLLLVRYNADKTLDQTFGDCGQFSWPADGLPPSFQVTSGVYHNNHIYLTTTNDAVNNDRVTLVSLGITPISYNTKVKPGSGVRINAMAFASHLYYTGTSGGDLLLGKSNTQDFFRTDNQSNIQEAGYALLAQKDYLYITGRTGNNLLIRKHDLELQPVSHFGVSGAVSDTFTDSSQGQALAFFNGMLYVAGNVEGDKDVFIRRYDLNGRRDDSFEVLQDTGIDGVGGLVQLAVSGNVLILFKHDPTADQVIARVFDSLGQEIRQHRLLTPRFMDNVTTHGLALDPANKRAYFVGRGSGGALVVETLDIFPPAQPSPTMPPQDQTDSAGLSAVGSAGLGLTLTAVMLATAVMATLAGYEP